MEGTVAAEDTAGEKAACTDPPTFEAVMALRAAEAQTDTHARPQVLRAPGSQISWDEEVDMGSWSVAELPGYEGVEGRRSELPVPRGRVVAA